MGVGYEYLNARAKALKAKLLATERLREFCRLGALPDLREALVASTPYSAELVTSRETASNVSAMERTLTLDLATTFRGLWHSGNDEVRAWLSLWLAPWDLGNLLLILRGWRAQLSPEDVASGWVPAAELSRQELEALWETNEVPTLAEKLSERGGMYHGLGRALQKHREKPLRVMEEAMFQSWASAAVSACEKRSANARTFARFFSWEIDGRNLVIALRLARDRVHEDSLFLPGGVHLPRARFRELARSQSLGEALDQLQNTVFAEALRAESPPYAWEQALGRIERRVQNLVLARCGREYRHADPLGIGVLLWYIQLKTNEVNNLKRIAGGLEHRLPTPILEEELVGE